MGTTRAKTKKHSGKTPARARGEDLLKRYGERDSQWTKRGEWLRLAASKDQKKRKPGIKTVRNTTAGTEGKKKVHQKRKTTKRNPETKQLMKFHTQANEQEKEGECANRAGVMEENVGGT